MRRSIWFACFLVLLTLGFGDTADAQRAPHPNRAEGRALVDAIGVDRLITDAAMAPLHPYIQSISLANKGREKEVSDIVMVSVFPKVRTAFQADPIKDLIADYYAGAFSVSELKELVAFCTTPTGKSFVTVSLSMNKILPYSTAWMVMTTSVMGPMMDGLEVMKNKGLVIPDTFFPK